MTGGITRTVDEMVRTRVYEAAKVKAQKNDDRDAEAIAEAATRPTMRFVELKSQAQLDMQTLHRVRDRLIGERTSLMNQIRACSSNADISYPKAKPSWRRDWPSCSPTLRLRLAPAPRTHL